MAGERERLLVLYDDECGFCVWSMAWLLRADRARLLQPVAIQSERGRRLLAGMPERRRLASWHVCDRDGLLASGGDGLAHVLGRLPAGAAPAALARRAPRLTARAYGWVAANRSRLGTLLPRASKERARGLVASRMQ